VKECVFRGSGFPYCGYWGGKGESSKVKGREAQRSKVKGQRLKLKGQSSKVKGGRAEGRLGMG
jgi:hypothetical protein